MRDTSDGPADAQRLIAELPRLGPAISAKLAATLYTARNPAEALARLRATWAALFRVGLLLPPPRRTHVGNCRSSPEQYTLSV